MTFVSSENMKTERADATRASTRARSYQSRSRVTFFCALAAILVTLLTALYIGRYVIGEGWPAGPVFLAGGAAVIASCVAAILALRGLRFSGASRHSDDIYAARAYGARASDLSWQSLAYSTAIITVSLIGWFLVVNDAAVSRTFFDLRLIFSSADLVLKAFLTNIYIFVVSGVLILIWALVIAVARTLPGKAGRPIRTLAIIYSDLFRGLPAIITIYLVGFGLPLTGLPFLSDLDSNTYAIIALVMTYGAYTSEVYRAGIESVHPSQISAARSLGLSYARTMRYVTLPLAVRGIVPPLLNNFISLQKDTALVNIIGTIDAFNQAKIIASNAFNLSAVTTVAILFILITIPQARFVDRLLERDRKRMRAAM
ncbi:amino acid ABC transporter permease [Cribrihabitans sp. XS_ASV171]